MQKEILRILSLGKFGEVTQNFFVYQFGRDLLIVDCGLGFSDQDDESIVLPDFSYLEKSDFKIQGLVLTHGHEDHIGGLSYFLTRTRARFPIFGSRLTSALAQAKLDEKLITNFKVKEVDSQAQLKLGPFDLSFVHVTHSIPDTFNLVIKTPAGLVYHASDFKFDWSPPLGRRTEVGKIAEIGRKGVDLLVSDCLRSEKSGYTLSESMIEESMEKEIKSCRGKFFVTTMSSNVSRWQQAINVAARFNRKIVPLGRSVEKIIDLANRLGYLKIPKNSLVALDKAHRLPPKKLAFLVAGSQAQPGSALDKLARGKSRVKINPKDKVVFSTDYIPGNEVAIYDLIDRLSRRGVDVSYSDIRDNLHVSGHGAQLDLSLMIGLTKPRFLLPIGGAFRHMRQYSVLAQKMGYHEDKILLPEPEQTIEVHGSNRICLGEKLSLRLSTIKQK